jgi:AAA family ATP:ADP antiporter
VLHGRLREWWQRQLERRAAGTLWLYLFLLIVGLTAGRAAGSALFLERYDESGLALLYVWVGGFLLLGFGLLHWLSRGLNATRLAQGVVLAQGLGIALLGSLYPAAEQGSSAAWSGLLCFWLELCSFLATLQFWTLTNRFFSSARARYWYAWIATGGIVGGIVGGGLSCWLSPKGLLFLAAGTTIPVLILLESFRRLSVVWKSVHPDQDRLRRPAEILLAANPTSDCGLRIADCELKMASRKPQVASRKPQWELHRAALPLALLTLLTVFTTTLCDFHFKFFADQTHGGNAGKLTRFFGNYYLVVGLTTLAIQLTATFWLLRRSCTFCGLLVLPLTLGCTSLANILWPGLLLATLLRLGDSTLSHSLNRSCRELLYTQLGRRHSRLQELCDGFAGRLGLVLAGLFLWVITAWLPHWSTSAYLFFLCFCVFAWLLTLVWLHQVSPEPTTAATPAATPQPIYLRIPVHEPPELTRIIPAVLMRAGAGREANHR